MTDFIKTLNERGFIYQASNLDSLKQETTNHKISAYIGFDCTADSLHVGSLVQIMMLRHLQKSGHTPIILLGSGTSKIGDPSFKDKSRPLLDDETIKNNKVGIKKVFSKFLNLNKAIFVDNNDWLQDLNYIDFLRDYGRHFTINRMLGFESVKIRLDREQPLTFLEFNYMLLQAYDFLQLYKQHNSILQMGGADQWGNIINGVELIRRVQSKEAYALTSPLLTTSSGKKMGKTENGAIWLNEEKTSSWDYWQFWRNTEDKDVGKFLKLFTELPLSEINKLEELKDQEINEAKKILASEATRLCHGEQKALEALKTADNTFSRGIIDNNLPSFTINKQELSSNSLTLIELLTNLNICKSKGEARRLINNRGIKVNKNTIEDTNYKITLNDLQDNLITISIGKKQHFLIKPQ